ncbi:NADP-dependent oxidoreductase [Brevirhabdus pacifica]|uniref:NADP-dependent oxidoreductase n=2 Tax=Brevirhabdus pacifica TaxID=1267768 RepID=A0A1U7DLA2_9RHOB|nr:NADP-dependent oxidoreductase [Brevirhabdus pacifica]APX90774.1 NADP-dependent oxidoreductase [Brevirhabdus pacifica]OWU79560.1 NADP-dependent oxidoreductase [Loktanella sp. 22II-4b]PJJ87347.1 hypothetical protein CLV77_1915 [Brevirhabdus pacifica]
MEYSRIVLASRPEGRVSENNFRVESGILPRPAKGEVLARVLYLSLDPYMRGRMDAGKSYAPAVEIGETMEGRAVAEVLESNDPAFAPGDLVLGSFGWASHGVLPAAGLMRVDPDLAPPSTALGVLGMPGFTGWLGLEAFGRPQKGETLVVGAATGAVGSMVGQLARLRGLRAVGVAGGPEKCDFAVKELGFDACLDHRAAPDSATLRKQLAQACPDGVDVYFENVGDKTLEAVLPLMNVGGRIPVCGMIGWYDLGALGAGGGTGRNMLPLAWRTILVQRLAVQGFIITDHYHRFGEFLTEVAPLVRDGRIAWHEDVAEGLEAAPQAFMNLLAGRNFGKQIVKVAQ